MRPELNLQAGIDPRRYRDPTIRQLREKIIAGNEWREARRDLLLFWIALAAIIVFGLLGTSVWESWP